MSQGENLSVGKISFKPSQLLPTVQYGYTIDTSILTDFSRGNFSYSFSVNLSDTTIKAKLPSQKQIYRPLKIKLWKLELKPVRKSVQIQKKLLIKLKILQEEWERNPVSEWKIPAGDIKVEFPIHDKLPSIHGDIQSPSKVIETNKLSTVETTLVTPLSSPKSISHPGSLNSVISSNSNELPNTNTNRSPLARPMLVHSKRSSMLMYRDQHTDNDSESQNNLNHLNDSSLISNHDYSQEGLDSISSQGRKLNKVDATAQTLIVAIQKRTITAATKKHRLSTTNISKNLFTESNSVSKNLFPDSNDSNTSPLPDINQRRRSFSSQQQSLLKTPLTISTSPKLKSREVRRRTLNLKIISADENYSDNEEATPTSPGSKLSEETQSVSVTSPLSSRSYSIDGSRNSDSIPKWAQRALSPASTPITMKKQKFIDRNDATSYAYIMYFIQGAHEDCFSTFKKFCKCILYVGAGSQESCPFTAHFSTLLEGSQYSLTERLFKMEQHNSRVPLDKLEERFRVFLLQLPTSDYVNEEWIMAHLRQASILAALTTPLEGLWDKPLKHLNDFRTCPTNDNTSVIMNETVGVEFNKVLRFERIQFGLNLLKIAFIRAQNESIELDLSDVKLIEKEKRRSGNSIPNVINGSPINEPVRIVDAKRYRLYFSKTDEEWLQLFPEDIKARISVTV